MSNNISTMYTKDKNQKAGRKGYVNWKTEKRNCYISSGLWRLYFTA